MFRRITALLLAAFMTGNATLALAAEAQSAPADPRLLATAPGAVEISRNSAENPMVEIARSVFYGALAGLVVGGAIELAAADASGQPIRWGIVAGTGVGLATGVYFVAHRPQPGAMLELKDGKLSPSPTALGAIEPVQGGARARLIGVRF